jgi:NAD-specific glutamate dehydrogenase
MPNHPHRDAILAAILQALRARVGESNSAEATIAFAAAALAQTRTSSVENVPPAAAAAGLCELWDFVRDAHPVGPNVKVRAEGSGAVLLSSMADQPFIVDTIRKALRARGAVDVAGVHVILRVVRGTAPVRLGADGEGRAESALRFRFDGVPAAELPMLEADLRDRLRLACSVVGDFESMTAAMEATADSALQVSGEDGIEAAEFLRWLLAENFVILGVTRTTANAPDHRLGADRIVSPLWPAAETGSFPGIVQVRKGNVEAPVHRNGRIDVIRIALPGSQTVVRGLFTHRALTQPCRHLPILRRALAGVLADTRQRPNSYRYRGLANIFDSLPTEWLFSATADQIRSVIELVFDAEQDQQVRVHVAQQDEGSTTFTLISIPERRYSEELRNRVQQQLATVTGANYTDSGLFAGRYDSVLLQVYQTGTRALTADDCAALQQQITALTTPRAERAGAAPGAFRDSAGDWTATTEPPARSVAVLTELTGASAAQVTEAWRSAITQTEGAQIFTDLRDASADPAGKDLAWTLYTNGIENLVVSWLNAGSDSAGSDSAGSDSAGSDSAGSDNAGSDNAGSDSAGSDSAAGAAGAHAADFNTALRALAQDSDAMAARHGHATIAQHVANGIPEALAIRIVDASNALYAGEICIIAQADNAPIADAAQRYAAVGQTTGLIAVIGAAPPGESRWDPLARHILRLRYTALLRELVLGVSGRRGTANQETLTRIATILQRVVGANPEVAALVAAEHQIRAVL